MRTLLHLTIALAFTACAMEQVRPDPEPCKIGHWISGPNNNVLFVRTTDADTIHVLWDGPYGRTPITWINGQTKWDCIGFSILDSDLSITLMTATDTCYFFIPKINH